jgi:hypothetical protein
VCCHLQAKAIDESALVVQWMDFEQALREVQPRLGADSDELQQHFRNGIVPYGPSFDAVITTLRRFVEQVCILH